MLYNFSVDLLNILSGIVLTLCSWGEDQVFQVIRLQSIVVKVKVKLQLQLVLYDFVEYEVFKFATHANMMC